MAEKGEILPVAGQPGAPYPNTKAARSPSPAEVKGRVALNKEMKEAEKERIDALNSEVEQRTYHPFTPAALTAPVPKRAKAVRAAMGFEEAPAPKKKSKK